MLQLDLILNLGTFQSLRDLSISYRRSKISNQYAYAVVQTFRKILGTIMLHDDYTVDRLDDISEEDRQKLISWNPRTPYAQMNCIHYLVEAVARAVPASEAVCAWDGSLTYAQLDALSSIAAEDLVRAGVRPGDYVPFAYEKSLWTIVAALAILKSGCAFVPLNPLHPKARLEEIVKNVGASIVVTSESFGPVFHGLVKHVVIISAQTISVHPFG